MNPLTLLDGPFSTYLAQTLLHFLWQGCVLGLSALAASWWLRKSPAQVRYAIHAAALVLMALCLPATYALLPAAKSNAATVASAAASARPATANPEQQTAEVRNIDRDAEPAAAGHSGDALEQAAAATSDQPVGQTSQAPLSAGLSGIPFANAVQRLAPYVTAAYLLGVSLMLVRLTVALWGGQRLRRASTPIQDASLLASIRRQAERIGLAAVPAALWCRRVSVPVVVGIVRPAILVPAQLATGLAPDQLASLLAHELAHIRRHDLLVNLLQRLIEAVLFFHPAVWLVSRAISRERENCCDDAVLALGWKPAQYADALLKMAELCFSPPALPLPRSPALLAASGESPSQFKRRLLRVLGVDPAPQVRLTRGGIVWLALALVPLFAAPLWLSRPAAGDAAPTERSEPAIARPAEGTWPQWGGSSHRNHVSAARDLPAAWDWKSGKNVQWSAPLGSQSYSSPVVAGGRVFIGTNNGAARIKRFPSEVDLACLQCFDATNAEFLWQYSSPKLPTGRAHDWPMIGLCGTPCVEGDRLWVVTNRCEVVCLDVDGFRDGQNDGPIQNEESIAADEADVVWRLDMMKELGVNPRHQACSSPTCSGELLLVNTSNSPDESYANVPAPGAPSFVALDRRTGQVVWSNAFPGKNILGSSCPGTSPAAAVIDGVPQAIFAGGDGWLYGFDLREIQQGKTKLLWKFDCNPKDSRWDFAGKGARGSLIATPVVHDGRVFIAVGRNPEEGEGPGRLWCIDPSKRGDISSELVFNRADPSTPVPFKLPQAADKTQGDYTRANPNSGVIWHYASFDLNGDGKLAYEESMHRSTGSVTIDGGLAVVADGSGIVHCLDAKTGRVHWTHDLLAAAWGTPLVADGKIYVGDEDGEIAIFRLAPAKEILAELEHPGPIYGTPAAVNRTLYVPTRGALVAVTQKAEPDPARAKPAAAPEKRMPPRTTAKAEPGRREIEVIAAEKSKLVGVERWTREIIWVHQVPDVPGLPATAEGRVYCGDEMGRFFCLDVQSGKPLWSIDADDAITGGPEVSGKRVLFGTHGGTLYCLQIDQGTEQWKLKLPDQIQSTPRVYDGKVVLLAGCDSHLHFIDIETGKEIRSLDMGGPTASQPLVLDDLAFIATEAGEVMCCRVDGSDWLWKRDVAEGKSVRGFGAVVQGLLVVGTRNKEVLALDPETGKTLWKTSVSSAVDELPQIVGEQVIARTTDGRTYALHRQTGKVDLEVESRRLIFPAYRP